MPKAPWYSELFKGAVSDAAVGERAPAAESERSLSLALSGEENLDYLLVLDFEATCSNTHKMNPQEIIEFPTVLVDVRTGRVGCERISLVHQTRSKHTAHPILQRFDWNYTTAS